MSKKFHECEEECTYEMTDRCTMKCSNCGAEADCYYPYWYHCPICGFKIKNRSDYVLVKPKETNHD